MPSPVVALRDPASAYVNACPLSVSRTRSSGESTSLMLTGVGRIEWEEPQIAIPAFLTLVTIPLTWSIADGLSFGLTSFAALELLTGRGRRQNWMLYLLAVLFLLRFVYLAKH